MPSFNVIPTGRLPLLATFCVTAAVLIACGGGGSDSSNASGNTASASGTSFASGPITGFGSVIVNGVRFDDSGATVSDDDAVAHLKDDLKLGMVAEVDGSGIVSDDQGGRRGLARAIVFRSEVVGPVDSVDKAARTLSVLGQVVEVTDTTVFDNRLSSGLDIVHAGDVVVVYGTLDRTTGHYTATRIEPKPNAPWFKLRGVVAGLDTTAHTLEIGGQVISFAGLAGGQVPSDLANGQVIRARLRTTQVAGEWVATWLQNGARHVEDHDRAEVKGRVTAFTSSAQFSVDGMPVDASKAVFPQGVASVVLGARVEVEGRAVAGVIIAAKVSVETEDDARHGRFELHGAVSGVDGTAKTFLLRGLAVSFADPAVQFKDGVASDLANGRQVEVKGALSVDGTRVVAQTIEFKR